MSTGNTIQTIRERLAMNKSAFGRACGVTGYYIARLEEGSRTPSVEVAERIKEFAASKKIKVKIEYDKKFKMLYMP